MPSLLDVFCGAGGAAMGYHQAGFDTVVGVDNRPQPRYPFHFIQADALDVLYAFTRGDSWDDQDGHEWHLEDFDAIHASPPCQGYSIMNNLPWLKGKKREYLILPTRELLNLVGVPYIIENVMGARFGAKGLAKRGLEAHGMQAGWLCGAAFGLPFYRHRLFETNWFWMQPGHPRHQGVIKKGRNLGEGQRSMVYAANSGAGRAQPTGSFDKWRASGDPMAALMGKMATLGKWQNGDQAGGVGIGHATGWRQAAEAMGIDWMNRDELTQAIPPAYTYFVGKQLIRGIADA